MSLVSFRNKQTDIKRKFSTYKEIQCNNLFNARTRKQKVREEPEGVFPLNLFFLPPSGRKLKFKLIYVTRKSVSFRRDKFQLIMSFSFAKFAGNRITELRLRLISKIAFDNVWFHLYL